MRWPPAHLQPDNQHARMPPGGSGRPGRVAAASKAAAAGGIS